LRAESSVDELRRLSQRIGAEETTDNKGNVMTRIERVLRTLAASSDPQALRIFLEYGFGRPVDRVEVDEVRPKTTLRLFFAHEFDKSLVTPPFERESSRTAVRMAKELAGACYLTPTTRPPSRATMRKPRPTSVVAVSNRRAKGSGDTAMPCSLSWSTKSRAALIGITDGPAKPNFP